MQSTRLSNSMQRDEFHSPFDQVRTSDGRGEAWCYQHLGDRVTQEDRFVFTGSVDGFNDCAFMGVFDGTVGDFASETVQHLVLPCLLRSTGWARYRGLRGSPGSPEVDVKRALESAVFEMFRTADEELVSKCRAASNHYSSSTGLCVLIAGKYLVVGHIGDSRACLLQSGRDSAIVGINLTIDHKPDEAGERRRIELSGGSVVYLSHHRNKPFIRGGDFASRKAMGQTPMQLQYSRAFGGKDLKMFGLSNEATVSVREIDHTTRGVVLASDGLWDVVSPSQVAEVFGSCFSRTPVSNPSAGLVSFALNCYKECKLPADNITAMVFKFN